MPNIGKEFEGVELTGWEDIPAGELTFGAVKAAGEELRITFFRPNTAPSGAEFLVREVADENGLVLWLFTRDVAEDFFGLAKLRFQQDGHCILLEKGKSDPAPEKIFLADLVKRRDTDKEYIKKLRRYTIMSRPVITVYTANGFNLFGVPVTEGEWKFLPTGTKAILVESYDSKTGTIAGPLEAFVVKKTAGGTCLKENKVNAQLQLEKPKPKVVEALKPERLAWQVRMPAIVNLGELSNSISVVVPYFPKSKGFFTEIAASLSEEEKFVALGQPDDKGQVLIFKKEKGKLIQIGSFKITAIKGGEG